MRLAVNVPVLIMHTVSPVMILTEATKNPLCNDRVVSHVKREALHGMQIAFLKGPLNS